LELTKFGSVCFGNEKCHHPCHLKKKNWLLRMSSNLWASLYSQVMAHLDIKFGPNLSQWNLARFGLVTKISAYRSKYSEDTKKLRSLHFLHFIYGKFYVFCSIWSQQLFLKKIKNKKNKKSSGLKCQNSVWSTLMWWLTWKSNFS
jgi:hypothetical protein